MNLTFKNSARKAAGTLATLVLLLALSGCTLVDPAKDQTKPSSQTTPPPTAAPTEETSPSEPIMGTVIAADVKIRAGVGDFHDETGVLEKGDRIEILEQVDVNGTKWGRISQGWINLKYVELEAQEDSEEASTEPRIRWDICQQKVLTSYSVYFQRNSGL